MLIKMECQTPVTTAHISSTPLNTPTTVPRPLEYVLRDTPAVESCGVVYSNTPLPFHLVTHPILVRDISILPHFYKNVWRDHVEQFTRLNFMTFFEFARQQHIASIYVVTSVYCFLHT